MPTYRQAESVSSAPFSKSTLYFAIILIGANLRAPITCVGPLLPEIQSSLHLRGLGAGTLNALPLLIFATLSLVAPATGRRYGMKRVLAVALCGIALGTLGRSLPVHGAIWMGTALLSAGIAFGNVLLPGLVKQEFPTRAAGLIGYYAAAMAGFAGLAAGVAVPVAQRHGSDWRWAAGIWALPAFAALALWLPQTRTDAEQYQTTMPAPVGGRLSPWRHSIGWQVSLFFALHSMVFYSLVDWFPSYAAASGIAPVRAGWYLLVYQGVAIATNLGSAPLIRRSDNQKLLGFACGLLLLIGTSGLLLLPGYSLLWLIAAGLGAGVAMVTSLSLFALRTGDHHQAASLSGMAQFVGYAGAAAGPFLVGVLREIAGNWTYAILLLTVASALVSVFATLAGRRQIIA